MILQSSQKKAYGAKCLNKTMDITSQNQYIIFLMCFVCGIIIGIIYDFFRIHRIFLKSTKISVIIADSFFWLLASYTSLQFIMLFNNGILRFFEFLAILLGTIIYITYISKVFTKIIIFLLKLLNKFSKLFLKIIFFPILFLCKVLKKPYFLIIYGYKTNFQRLKRFSKKI